MSKIILPQSDNETPFSLYIDSLRAAGSKRSMSQILHKIADHLSDSECDAYDYAWHKLDQADLGAVKDWLQQEEYAPATINKGLSALRGVLLMAVKLKQISLMDRMLLISNLPSVENHVEQAGRLIKDDELRDLFTVCRNDKSTAGIRDYAMLTLLYATGARRSELIHLDIADFDAKDLSLSFRQAKGWKDRVVFINPEVAAILSKWLRLVGQTDGPIFRRILKGDTLTNTRLTDQGLFHILTERAGSARLAPMTPHDFRRTFISKLLDQGIDMVTLAKVVGHESVKQTMAYDRRGLAPMTLATLALP